MATKFKAADALSSKGKQLKALVNGFALCSRNTNVFIRFNFETDNLEYFCDGIWRKSVMSLIETEFKKQSYIIDESSEWYENIPDKGILCRGPYGIVLATRICSTEIYSDEVEINHSGCRYKVKDLTPLTKKEIIELCYNEN